MKALVVYYSRSGNNHKIAGEVAKALGADIERLKEKADRSGSVGYMKAGRDSMKKRPAELEPVGNDAANYDVVVLGGPVWAWAMNPPVRTYALQNKDRFRKLAVFSTGGAAQFAQNAIDDLRSVTGISPVATLALSDKDVGGNHSKALSDFVAAIAARG